MKNLALILLAGLTGAGCATDSGDDTGGGDDLPPFTNGVSTLSGSSEPGYVDGDRGKARFANPVNVAYGPDGMLYVADFDNNKLRVVDPSDGHTETTLVVEGFQRPFAMTFASDGAFYVSTDRNPQGKQGVMTGTIWKVDIGAGTATPIAANIGRPRGLAMLPNGKLAVADYEHHVVQLLDPATGVVTLLAGQWDAKGMVDGLGAGAMFSTPYGLAVSNGRLVVADFDNHRLRIVGMDGVVTTLAGIGTAGFADGSMTSAKFNKPQGIAAAANGDIYVTDLQNNRVRRISGTTVETIAGNGEAGYLDSDDRLAAQLYGLEGLSVAPDGSMVFVADGGRGEPVAYNRVRSVKMK